jgi:restriction system protein
VKAGVRGPVAIALLQGYFESKRRQLRLAGGRQPSPMPELPVLDYSSYVEIVWQEEAGTYGSWPSARDVAAAVPYVLGPRQPPEDPSNAPYEYYCWCGQQWQEFVRSRDEAFGSWHYVLECPHCGARVDKLPPASPPTTSSPTDEGLVVRVCSSCGWWESDRRLTYEEDKALPGWYQATGLHRRAFLRRFTIGGTEAPLVTLQEHIARHPGQLGYLSPTRLEHLVGRVFGEFMDCEAVHVGGPNDRGIDVLLIRDGVREYAIQVKRRRTAARPEAVSGIREFLGAMLLDGAAKGLFVTTAHRFSDQAVRAAIDACDRGLVDFIDLVPGDRLVDVCKLTAGRAGPSWSRATADTHDGPTCTDAGFQAFMALLMGHTDWRVASPARR